MGDMILPGQQLAIRMVFSSKMGHAGDKLCSKCNEHNEDGVEDQDIEWCVTLPYSALN